MAHGEVDRILIHRILVFLEYVKEYQIETAGEVPVSIRYQRRSFQNADTYRMESEIVLMAKWLTNIFSHANITVLCGFEMGDLNER